MRKHDWALCALAVGFAFWAACILIARLIPESQGTSKIVEVMTGVLSAIATLLAALVALHLGRSAERREEKRHRLLAKLAAGRVLLRVSALFRLAEEIDGLSYTNSSEEQYFQRLRDYSSASPDPRSRMDVVDEDIVAVVIEIPEVVEKVSANAFKLRLLLDQVRDVGGFNQLESKRFGDGYPLPNWKQIPKQCLADLEVVREKLEALADWKLGRPKVYQRNL